MALIVTGLPSMTTTGGSTTSSAVGTIDDAWGLTIYAPAALTSTTNTVEVEPTSTGTNFVTLQSGGVDVTFVASKATVISPVPFRQIRIVGNAAEITTRTFTLTKAVQT